MEQTFLSADSLNLPVQCSDGRLESRPNPQAGKPAQQALEFQLRGKSILLRTRMRFLPANSARNFSSASVNGSEASNTCKINSAFCKLSRLRRIPSTSISSRASRNPAVSMNTTGNPRMFAVSSMVSRVVPGIGETMARSCPSN